MDYVSRLQLLIAKAVLRVIGYDIQLTAGTCRIVQVMVQVEKQPFMQ